MPIFKRCDGTLLKKLPAFRRINPYLMRTRTESTVFIPLHIDVTNSVEYLKKLREKTGEKVSIFNIVLAAAVRTYALRPELNRFVVGTKIYQRKEISFSFVVKKQKTDKAVETMAKMKFSPYETIFTVMDKLKNHLGEARKDEDCFMDKDVNMFGSLPGFLLRFVVWAFKFLDRHNLAPKSMIDTDPLYTSLVLTNMGSIGMELGIHHHLFEWGNTSLFVSVSQYHKRPVVDSEGNIVVRDLMDLIISWDDRIADGLYGQNSAELMKYFMEHPEELEAKPEIPQETLDLLMLDPIDDYCPDGHRKKKKSSKSAA